MSLWDEGQARFPPKPSFTQAVPAPSTDPGSGPLICVHFNQEWLPVVLGALLQLCQPPSWAVDDPDALNTVLGRATLLLDMFGQAELCPVTEDGIVTLTITAGNASASTTITFVQTYATAPLVDCSCDNPDLISSWSDVSTTGATLTITAATPVTESTSADVSWSTN